MPLEQHPERRGVPTNLRHAISIAEQSAIGGCKVLPGTKWGVVYSENGARRHRAIQGLLDGSATPENAANDLRPDALIFNVSDIDTLGIDAVKARVRDATGNMQHYNYDRFAQFIAQMKGKDVDPAMLEQLYDGIAGTRTRSALLQGLGQTGQRDMRTALHGEAQRTTTALDDLYGIRRVTDALKLRWLRSQGFGDDQADQALGNLRPAETALIDMLGGHFEQFVNTGDQASYVALVEAIEQNLPALEQISQQQSESMEHLEEELEKYKDKATPPGAPDDPAIPPDDQDEYHTPPPQMEGEESAEGQSQPPMFEITPSGTSKAPIVGYYRRGCKSYYDGSTKTWSKRKQLMPYSANIQGDKRQTIRGTIDAGLKSLPLPAGYAVDTASVKVEAGATVQFSRDQNGCFYVQSTGGPSRFSVDFLQEQQPFAQSPVSQDISPLHGSPLSAPTEQILKTLKGSAIERAEQIGRYIRRTHFYPGGGDAKAAGALQWKLREENTGDTYLTALDASEYLECYSSNTLFVHLCRRAGIPARLVVGDKIDGATNGKARIDSGTGHAWTEIWDGAAWRRIDGTPPAKPEDQKKKKNDKQQQGQSTPSDEANDGGMDNADDMNDQVQDRVDQQMQSVKDKSRGTPNDDDVRQGEQMLDDAQKMMDKMQQRLREFQDKAKKSDGFEDLEKIRDEAKKDELLPEDQEELERNIDAQEKQMREEMQEKMDSMQKDGFIDEKKKQQLERRLDEKDARALDQLWDEIDRQGSLHAEFENIREEVRPLVDQWYQHFYERLPRRYDPEADTDVLTRGGALDRRALRHPRNLMFGKVFHPRVLRPTVEPRFLASIMVDVSGSMEGEKLKNARKLLVFYCELFSRISKEFGYIRFAASTFSDTVTPIKTYGHDYDSAEQFNYPDGSSTVKARLMTHLKTAGGTDMLGAVKNAAEDLHAEMDDYPDYASAFYFVGDGDDTHGNANKVRQFLEADDRERGLGQVMRSAILLGEEKDRQALGAIFGNENTTVASTFEDLVEQSMYRFDEQIEQYLEQFQ